MVSLVRRADGGRYACATGLVELAKVANGEHLVPREFINVAGNGVTEAFKDYVRPLVQGQAAIDIGPDGLPVFARLAKHGVAKRTGREYST